MKIATFICFGLFLAGVLLFLAQLWFDVFASRVFDKIIITDAAFFLIAVVAVFLVRENRESKKIHDGELK